MDSEEYECPFCPIIKGEAPATVLADGISSIAIEPLNPVTPGHFIVIPRQHVSDAYDNPSVTATAMFDASQWAKMFSWRDSRYESVNLITSVGTAATQSVFHLHIHVVPRENNDGLALPWYSGKTKE